VLADRPRDADAEQHAPVLRRRTYQSRTACSSCANSAAAVGREENSTVPSVSSTA
jgi:hypothetical protein